MRLLRLLVSCCVLLTATVLVAAPATAEEPHYYVALGDSLSRGYMPGPGDTDQGYVDDLYTTLHAEDPSLQLVKLGCSGETTGTMIDGGKCTDRYPVGSSQLAAAEAFLTAHRGAVTHLTIDIGANDVAGCAEGGSIDPACLTKGVVTIATNLQTILQRLTAAGHRTPLSIAMNYYDPFLQNYLGHAKGKAIAVASVGLLATVNTAESALYNLYGFRVADVARAYRTYDFLNQETVPGFGKLPRNVATICKLTYMCSDVNIHANVEGYRVIADAFRARLG